MGPVMKLCRRLDSLRHVYSLRQPLPSPQNRLGFCEQLGSIATSTSETGRKESLANAEVKLIRTWEGLVGKPDNQPGQIASQFVNRNIARQVDVVTQFDLTEYPSQLRWRQPLSLVTAALSALSNR